MTTLFCLGDLDYGLNHHLFMMRTHIHFHLCYILSLEGLSSHTWEYIWPLHTCWGVDLVTWHFRTHFHVVDVIFYGFILIYVPHFSPMCHMSYIGVDRPHLFPQVKAWFDYWHSFLCIGGDLAWLAHESRLRRYTSTYFTSASTYINFYEPTHEHLDMVMRLIYYI